MQKIHFKTTIWLGSEVLEGLKELKNRRIFLVADHSLCAWLCRLIYQSLFL